MKGNKGEGGRGRSSKKGEREREGAVWEIKIREERAGRKESDVKKQLKK